MPMQEKLYALDLERVARGEDRRTTLMIKNIPNKCAAAQLPAQLRSCPTAQLPMRGLR